MIHHVLNTPLYGLFPGAVLLVFLLYLVFQLACNPVVISTIVLKSLRQHALSTFITSISIGLGCGLLMAVWVVNFQTQRSFKNVTGGFDSILGPRGSQLQLVLNSLFHMDSSPGLVNAEDYRAFRQKYKRFYQAAVPIAVGDNYNGYRIVGTTHDLFGVEHSPGQIYELAAGELFIQNDKQWNKESVIGSTVASKLGLRVNSKFQPYHGLNFDPNQEPHKDEYTVTGILKPTGTPADQVIWIPIEGLQQMDGHDSKYSGDVSAVLIQMSEDPTSRGFGMNSLDSIYNKGTDHLTFVRSTDDVVTRLFDQFAWAEIVLRWVAYLVAVVAAGGVLASIYNSMNERRREFAILRALGAGRNVVFSIIVLESAVIAAIGAVIGFGVYALIMVAAGSTLRGEIGVTLRLLEFHPIMVVVPAGLIVLGAVVGIVPALKAYSTDVVENLIPQT